MKFAIAGKNNIAVNILLYLLSKNIKKENIFILTNKTDDGTDNWQRSLLKISLELKLNIVELKELYNMENLIFLSLEYDKIIKPNLFKTKKLFNIHFSLLPAYKGMYTSILPILNNESKTGVTFHNIDQGIDTGDIIEQVEFPINKMDNSRDIYIKYLVHGTKLVKDNLEKIFNHISLISYKQDYKKSSYFSKKSIEFENLNLDLNQTSINIHNQIRAFNFREYQVPSIKGHKIISSIITSFRSKNKSGEILFEDEISLMMSTIDYDILLYKDKSVELFDACSKGEEDKIEELLHIPKIINIQNDKGWTPLIVAIYNGHYEIVKKLILRGADFKVCNFKGTTTLMYARNAYTKYFEKRILRLLLKLDPELVYKKDFKNKSIIEYCLENNELEILAEIKGEK